MNPSSETLLTLWHDNASPWTQAVRDKAIESRRLATDQAVIDAVLATGARRVLDVGCGEGWLTRALTEQGLETLGLDAVAPLIDKAQQAGGGQFAVAPFDTLMDSALAAGFDTWVCNFSLFHPDDGRCLAAAAARRLPAHGALVIQTLHANATTQGPHSGDAGQLGLLRLKLWRGDPLVLPQPGLLGRAAGRARLRPSRLAGAAPSRQRPGPVDAAERAALKRRPRLSPRAAGSTAPPPISRSSSRIRVRGVPRPYAR